MSEGKFTPGPWFYISGPALNGRYHAGHADVGAEDFALVCECYEGDEDEQEANARLIAAAPELYEALRKAIANLEMAEVNSYAFEGDDDPDYIRAKEAWQNDIAFFRAALLKASGGSDV